MDSDQLDLARISANRIMQGTAHRNFVVEHNDAVAVAKALLYLLDQIAVVRTVPDDPAKA